MDLLASEVDVEDRVKTGRRSSDSRAVLSSSLVSSSSTLDDLLELLGPFDEEDSPLCIVALLIALEGRRMLPAFALLLSPVLPLPVELVAGGDGRPDVEWGLAGGSGRSGRWMLEVGVAPKNIAETGRFDAEEVRREFICNSA